MTGPKLAEQLKIAGMSQQELADRLGISRRAVVYWLTGQRPIPETWFVPIAIVLARRPLATTARRSLRVIRGKLEIAERAFSIDGNACRNWDRGMRLLRESLVLARAGLGD